MTDDERQVEWVEKWDKDQTQQAEAFEKLINSHRKNKLIYRTIIISMSIVIIGDLASSLDNYAMTHDWFYTQMITGMSSQLTWLCMSFLFVNAESKKQRIIIGVSQALGASIGSSLMLKYAKPFIISLF
mgnify:CR=1 FL=1